MARLISVITVNRNDAAGLRATAQSVATQARLPNEWLVVDGGSTDGSLEVIRHFERWITFWSSAPDRGVYDAMNQGLRRARGRYVIFMNGGDAFARPDSLARIAGVLESCPDVDLLFGGTILALPSGRRIYRPPHPAARLPYGLPAYHQATAIRRTAHLMAPYDLALPISAEYGSIATLISRGATSVRFDQPIAIRACHRDSLSERETLQRFADFVAVQRQVLGLSPLALAGHLARLAAVHLAYRMARDARAPAHGNGEEYLLHNMLRRFINEEDGSAAGLDLK
jgi:putative colanic acid biosynthesis glycosyltransferase